MPIVLSEEIVAKLFEELDAAPGYRLTIDLEAQTVTTPGGESFEFSVDPFRRDCLLKGLDDIGLTLQHTDEIRDYEQRRAEQAPWLFD